MTRRLYNFARLAEDVDDRGWNAITVADLIAAIGRTVSVETVRRALRGANYTSATVVAIAEVLGQPISRYKLAPGRKPRAVPDGRTRRRKVEA